MKKKINNRKIAKGQMRYFHLFHHSYEGGVLEKLRKLIIRFLANRKKNID